MANTTRRSIELEPKTLSQGELSQARKVAADVVQKMEPREASSLFIEGLENSSVEYMKEMDEEEEEEEEDKGEKEVEEKQEKTEEKIEEKGGCNMSVCSSPSDQLHHIRQQHEPLSAPF